MAAMFAVAPCWMGTLHATGDVDGWEVRRTQDPLTGAPVVTISVPADAPVDGSSTATHRLVVRCRQPLGPSGVDPRLPYIHGLEVYIDSSPELAPTPAPGAASTVLVRFDTDPPLRWRVTLNPARHALRFDAIYSAQMVAIDRRLVQARRMTILNVMVGGVTSVLSFPVQDFGKHLDDVLAACPAFDESLWLIAPSMRRYQN